MAGRVGRKETVVCCLVYLLAGSVPVGERTCFCSSQQSVSTLNDHFKGVPIKL